MSVDHGFDIGGDSSATLRLNISGVDTDAQDIEGITANFFAFDSTTGSPKFTCSLSVDDLRRLYNHLGGYSVIADESAKRTGRFVELNEDDAGKLPALLSQLDGNQLVPVLTDLVANRLSREDINTILGRRDALAEYQRMLDASPGHSEPEWQAFFERNEWIFGYGLKYQYLRILQREASVSGGDIDGGNTVVSDFMVADARFTKLVELKKPDTKLFDNRINRSDAWRLSRDLTDAVSQILAQKASWELRSSHGTHHDSAGRRIRQQTADVECFLIIGSTSEISGTDEEVEIKMKTLELYRRNLRHIEILFYDELLERARFIVEGAEVGSDAG